MNLLSSILFLWSSQLSVAITEMRYCVPIEQINWNPYREIQDGKELAYLVLLRSYISTDPLEPGLLQGYEFSPDGREFTGRLQPDLKWPDGTYVTPGELAQGILMALPFRALGKRVQVEIPAKTLDSSTFRIQFKSSIQNLTGVIREALSTNSRHNRFWPAKIVDGKVQVIAKFPIENDTKEFVLKPYGQRVRVVAQKDCHNPEFSIFPEVFGTDLANQTTQVSSASSQVTLQPNTARLTQRDRHTLSHWLREVFKKTTGLGFESVNSFFKPGEMGYRLTQNWSRIKNTSDLTKQKIVIGYEFPLLRTVVESASKKPPFEVKLVPLPTSEPLDAQILVSGIQEGRHLILQDALQWPYVSDFMIGAPKSVAGLKEIAKRSASTMPPDTQTLQIFERSALEEISFVPLARKHPVAYSRKGLPICADFSVTGEVTFKPKERCLR